MKNDVLVRARRVAVGALVALVASVLLMCAPSRSKFKTEAPPDRTESLPEWVEAWQDAGPDERVEIARRIDSEEPLRGLTAAECIRVLGPPDRASWCCGVRPYGVLRRIVLFSDMAFLDVYSDEDGFVKAVGVF